MTGYNPKILEITFPANSKRKTTGAATSAGIDTSAPALKKYKGVKKNWV